MAVTTTESFLQLLAKSQLLDQEQLAQVEVAARQTDDVKKLARSMVRQEMLSRWQAIQLLAGRSAFFLGKYKLIDLLGSGGMGRVFLAEHTTMGRPVALKIIAKRLAQDPVSLKQFLTEARAIAALDHPNIVHPYSVDSEGDRYYMVMEYVEGRDLQRTVEADGPLEFDRAADYICQAADGLAHAHSREMIHCDVKPANLLVNGQDVVKILDMGMARLTGRRKGGAAEKDERLLGTVDYLAPEQALDSPDLDHRVDIYSLGCTFYFLLTGGPPFPEGTLHERILKHQTEAPRAIRELRPDTPEDLVEICARMMAKAPDDRYASADDLSRVLADRQPVLEMAELAEAIVEPESPVDVAGIRAETPTKRSALGKAGGATGALARMRGTLAEHPRMWLFAGLGGMAALVLVVGLILLLVGPGEGPEDKSGVQTASTENQTRSEKSSQVEPTEPEELEAGDEWPDLPDLGNLRDFDPGTISKDNPDASGKSGQAAPPEKPKEEKPGAEKQKAEKPASEGLKMGTPANPPQAKPAPADAKPPAKPEPPKPAPKPEEPEKTEPAKTEPEKPKPEKKEPKKPKPQDPLRELAEAVDIPELSSGSGAPEAGPFTIGKIHTEPNVPWQLYLLGGQTVLRRNRAFVLEQDERDAAKASWRIQLETAATNLRSVPGGGPTREDVAKIYREGDLLQFRWAENAPSAAANYLRNCILQVRVEGKSKYPALTTPKPVEPISIDLERGIVNASATVKWLPEGGDVRMEITKVEGRDGHAVDPPEPAELKKPLQLSFPRKDRNGNTPDGVVFRLTLNPRPAAMSVKLQLLEPPSTSFRSLKGQAEIRRNQLEIVRDELNKKLKPANKDQAPKGEEKSRLLRDLDGIEMNMWYIDFYNEVHQKATIHYRVFTEIDGRQVVLASTVGGPSPESPSPADSSK